MRSMAFEADQTAYYTQLHMVDLSGLIIEQFHTD